MGLIARIKDRLFDRRNIFEVEQLEVDGQSVPLDYFKNTNLYRHKVLVKYYEHSSSYLIFINNSPNKITIDDFTPPDSDHYSKLKHLILDSILAYKETSNIIPFAKTLFTYDNDTNLKEIIFDYSTGEISFYSLINNFPTRVDEVTDTVTQL